MGESAEVNSLASLSTEQLQDKESDRNLPADEWVAVSREINRRKWGKASLEGGSTPHGNPGAIGHGLDQRVVVTDVAMPFWSMVWFMIKWSIASIPAFIVLFVLGILALIFLRAVGGALSTLRQ